MHSHAKPRGACRLAHGKIGCWWALQVQLACTIGEAERRYCGWLSRAKNLANVWELVGLIRSNDLPFVWMGDGKITLKEMEKTEMMGSIGEVMKTPAGVELTCSSGTRFLDYAFVDRRLECVVTVEPFLSVPWKSDAALEIHIIRAPRSHTVGTLHASRRISRKESREQQWTGVNIWSSRRHHRREPLK